MANKKALGRGLDEIFGEGVDSILTDISNGKTESNSASELDIKDIRPNPYQPRKTFDEKELQELAESIKVHGVFQPILVRKALSGYDLVSGERRLRASKLAGKKKIPAIVVDFNDSQMMEVALLENIQRKDLNPIEEAEGYDQLIKKFNYTQEQLADRLGKSRANITNMLRLLNLPDEVREYVLKGKLSYTKARTLLTIEDEEKMKDLADRAVKEDLSVRQLEKLSKEKKSGKKTSEKPVDPFMEDVRNKLQHKYSTKVEFKNKSIIISYNDNEDLNRILEIMNVIDE